MTEHDPSPSEWHAFITDLAESTRRMGMTESLETVAETCVVAHTRIGDDLTALTAANPYRTWRVEPSDVITHAPNANPDDESLPNAHRALAVELLVRALRDRLRQDEPADSNVDEWREQFGGDAGAELV